MRVRYAKMIGTGVDSFVHDLPGQTIERIGRRGKYLLFYLTGGVLVSPSANGRQVSFLS